MSFTVPTRTPIHSTDFSEVSMLVYALVCVVLCALGAYEIACRIGRF